MKVLLKGSFGSQFVLPYPFWDVLRIDVLSHSFIVSAIVSSKVLDAVSSGSRVPAATINTSLNSVNPDCCGVETTLSQICEGTPQAINNHTLGPRHQVLLRNVKSWTLGALIHGVPFQLKPLANAARPKERRELGPSSNSRVRPWGLSRK